MGEYKVSEEKAREIEEKIKRSKEVIREAFQKFKPSECAITWTGGKDSTTNLWLIRQVCIEDNIDLPHVITIDEGDAFPEITDFLIKISLKEWVLIIHIICLSNMKMAQEIISIQV